MDGHSKGTDRSIAARRAASDRQERSRFYIALNMRPAVLDPSKPGWPPNYRRFVWPKLYKTRAEAEAALGVLPWAKFCPPGYHRVVSATVERSRSLAPKEQVDG